MIPEALEGTAYPPVAFHAGADRIATFVAATGDDPARWPEHAPPGFAAAALFAVAPALLADETLQGASTIIHSDQTFRWRRPLAAGEEIAVSGEVTKVRVRGPLAFVTFEAELGNWAHSVSTFLLSDGAASASPALEEEEPAPPLRAVNEVPATVDPPGSGEALPPLAKSASRLDLVRYAAASGDFNPLHWDHATAVTAGLPGVVVHGLLSASWLLQGAAAVVTGPHPLAVATIRFRRPLRPAIAAQVTGEVAGTDPLRLSMAVGAGGEGIVTGSVTAVTT